jgi:hypothetical protein
LAIEPDIEDQRATIQQLVAYVGLDNVKDIWSVTIGNSLKAKHYVLLLQNFAHLCSCLTIIRQGIVCRHYFQVMLATSDAKFHIRLIPSRWYQKASDMTNPPFLVADKFATQENNHPPVPPVVYLYQFDKKKDFMEQGLKTLEQKIIYGKLHGIYKQALRKALDTKSQSQRLIELLEDFVNSRDTDESEDGSSSGSNKENRPTIFRLQNPKIHRRKGRPAGTKRFKSSHEQIRKETNQRKCKKCGGAGHYQKNCKSV